MLIMVSGLILTAVVEYALQLGVLVLIAACSRNRSPVKSFGTY